MDIAYRIFDDEVVQQRTRRAVARLGVAWVALALLTLAVVAASPVGTASGALVAAAVIGLASALGAWTVLRFVRLRHVAWCIKLSPQRIVGFNYTRRRLTLDWLDVRHVAVADDGLHVASWNPRIQLHIPTDFPDYAELSHALVALAEARGCPVLIDGTAWADIDVYELYPFLRSRAAAA